MGHGPHANEGPDVIKILIKTGSSSTLVVIEWNSPQSYRYFDDVTIFFRILHLSENLLLCLSHSAVLDKEVTLCIRQKKVTLCITQEVYYGFSQLYGQGATRGKNRAE